eukprot:3199437-Pyramimonas_sp.AAC.1
MGPTRIHWYDTYSAVELVDERRRQHGSSYAQRARSRLGRQRDLQQFSLRSKTSTRPLACFFRIIPDMDKNMDVVLVLVDIASDFTVPVYARPGSRPEAELAKKAFELGWLTWAGPPTVVEQD